MSLCILLADPKKIALQEYLCSKGNHQQAKAYANVTHGGGAGFNLSRQYNLALWPHSSVLIKDTVKGLWNLLQQLKKARETRCVTEESLHCGLKRPLREAVKVRPGLHWKLSGGHGRTWTYLSRATKRMWNQPKRRKCVSVNKAGRNGI